MKPSTLVELAGFACLTIAAFLVNVVAGFTVGGISLLFIGYGTDDRAAGLSVARMVEPFRTRRASRRSRRAAKKAAKAKTREK